MFHPYPFVIMYNFPVMNIQDLTREMDRFVTAKGWYLPDSPRPQTPKNLAISLCIEAAEVLELFQWSEKTTDLSELADELADVTLYLLQLARVADIDLERAVMKKLEENYLRTWDERLDAEKDKNGEED